MLLNNTPARAPAQISKVVHSRGLRPLPPPPKKRCRREVSENASKTVLQSVARSVAHAQVLFLETEIARTTPFAIPFGTKKSCRGTVLSQNVDRRRRRIEVELVSASLRVTSPRAASRGHRGLAKRLDKRPLRRGFEYTAKHLPQRFRTSCCRKLFKKVVEIVVELTQNWCRDVFGVVPWGPKRLPRNEQAATRDPRGRSSDYSRELLENLGGRGLSY